MPPFPPLSLPGVVEDHGGYADRVLPAEYGHAESDSNRCLTGDAPPVNDRREPSVRKRGSRPEHSSRTRLTGSYRVLPAPIFSDLTLLV